MWRFLTAALILVALFTLVKTRFRMLNYLLAVEPLRKWFVMLTMKIPFIRKNILPQ